MSNAHAISFRLIVSISAFGKGSTVGSHIQLDYPEGIPHDITAVTLYGGSEDVQYEVRNHEGLLEPLSPKKTCLVLKFSCLAYSLKPCFFLNHCQYFHVGSFQTSTLYPGCLCS